MLYVHPAAAGQGAGAMLCDALEKLAAAAAPRNSPSKPATPRAASSKSAASSARTRNTVSLAGEWLANTTMSKPLAGEGRRIMNRTALDSFSAYAPITS